MALAYFITFSTYGTWLHGSSKGMGSVDREHKLHGTPFVTPSVEREREKRALMVQPPYVMNAAERDVVRDAIVGIAFERGWRLFAVHVRSNHVHVVARADRAPERVMGDLKARASRELTRKGMGYSERRRWKRHGSTKHLFDWAAVQEKIDYTLYEQGAPMSLYDGTREENEEPRTQ